MIWAILVLSFIIRLIAVEQSFWLDEAIGALAVKNYSYKGIVTEFLTVDNHPPLYYLLLKFWTSIFGFSEIAFRSLSILFSLLAIYYAYKLVLLLSKNSFAAYFSAVFLMTSQYFVYYSHEARMYMPAAGACVFSVYYFLKLLNKDNKILDWILFSLGLTSLIFMDYVPIFIYPAFLIVALLHKADKKWWGKFILSHSPLAILGLGWLPIFLQQSKNSPYILEALPGWKDVAGGANFKQIALLWMKFTSGRISLVNKTHYYVYVILASLPFIFLFLKNIYIKKLRDIYIFVITPIILLFFASFFFPGFIYFRLTFIYPLFAVVISVILFNKKAHYLIAGIIIFTNCASLFVYYNDVNQQREQWRQAVDYIESNANREDLILFEYPDPFSPYRWYESGEFKSEGALLKITANTTGTKEHLNDLLENQNTVYHFEYLVELSDPKRIVESTLAENGFEKISENANFVGIGKITLWQSSP